MNGNPDAEKEVKLCSGVCKYEELYHNYGDAQEVDVLLQPYKSQHPSPASIGCHLKVQQEEAKNSCFLLNIMEK